MHDVCARMARARYVASDFLERTKQREQISPTNYGKIAIPHPSDYFSVKTVIEVTILKRSILWNTSQVNIIFTIALARDDYPEFQNIFSFLTSICIDPNSMSLLSSAGTYEEFMNVLMTLYEKH